MGKMFGPKEADILRKFHIFSAKLSRALRYGLNALGNKRPQHVSTKLKF